MRGTPTTPPRTKGLVLTVGGRRSKSPDSRVPLDYSGVDTSRHPTRHSARQGEVRPDLDSTRYRPDSPLGFLALTRHVPRASAHRLGAAGWTVRRLAVQPRFPGKTPSTDAPSSHEPGGNSPARTASSPSQGRVTLPDDFPGKTVRAFPGARTHPALKSTMRKKNAHATTLCATLARHLWPRMRAARAHIWMRKKKSM